MAAIKGTGVSLEGVEELDKLLKGFAPKKAESILRGATQAIAVKAAKEIRKAAPKKNIGRLKKAKNIRATRNKPRNGLITSTVDASGPAFIWRFVEHGTSRGQKAQPFVQPAMEAFRPTVKPLYEQEFLKRYEKAMAQKLKKGVRK